MQQCYIFKRWQFYTLLHPSVVHSCTFVATWLHQHFSLCTWNVLNNLQESNHFLVMTEVRIQSDTFIKKFKPNFLRNKINKKNYKDLCSAIYSKFIISNNINQECALIER